MNTKLELKPATVDECMEAFSQLLTPQEQMDLVKCSKQDLIMYHHGLGQWVRNNWDLWKGGALADHLKALGFKHPDDMSQSLIEEFWARMNKLPSTMAEDIQKYAEYWKDKGQ